MCCASIKKISTNTTADCVIITLTVNRVVTFLSKQAVIANAAKNAIRSITCTDRVIAANTVKCIAACVTSDLVRSGGSNNIFNIGKGIGDTTT